MANISFNNTYGLYKFTLNDDVIALAPNFETFLTWTDRNEQLYEIYSIGKNNNKFFYKERYYTLRPDNVRILSNENTVEWSKAQDGDFELVFGTNSRPQVTSPYMPEEVATPCVEFINMYKVDQEERVVIESMTTGNDPTGQTVGTISEYIELVIAPASNFRFIGTNLPIIIGIPYVVNGGIKEVTLVNKVGTENHYTITELRQDGKLHVYALIGAQYYQLSEHGYKYVKSGNATGIVITNEYNVELSLLNITGSNTSSTASTSEAYVNVLTADSGYTMDDVEVTVLMAGIPVHSAYNPVTRTVRITQVTGDIVISASGKKIHTFRFYSNNGQTLRATINSHSITNILMTIANNVRTIKVNDVTIATYTEAIPENKTLLGLTTALNSDRLIVTLDFLYTGVFKEDTDFYEVIADVPVVTEDLTLNLYHNKSKKDVVTKTLISVRTITGTLRSATSILSPQIMIEYASVIDFDYVFIPQFNRYYYVTDVISYKKNLWIINLKVDVLMTYANLIRLQTAYVLRNQYEYTPNITDNYISFDYDKSIEYKIIEYDDEIYDFNYVDDNSFRNFIMKIISAY